MSRDPQPRPAGWRQQQHPRWLGEGWCVVTAAERATVMAAQGAAEARAAAPPALVLPDGWETVPTPWGDYYKAPAHPSLPSVQVDDGGVEIGCWHDPDMDAEATRSLAGRLVEAAAIVEALRAGAR